MLKRIERQKPNITRKNWINDRVQNLTYLQNITSYPEKLTDKKREIEILHHGRKIGEDDAKILKLRKTFLAPVARRKRNPTKKIEKIKKIPQIPESDAKIQMESSPTISIAENA